MSAAEFAGAANVYGTFVSNTYGRAEVRQSGHIFVLEIRLLSQMLDWEIQVIYCVIISYFLKHSG